MPELPEVETIKLGLQRYLVGHRITKVEVRLAKIVKEGDVKNAEGGKVKGVRRFGKALIIDLNNGYSVAAHIKLTGQFVYVGPKRPKNTKISEEKVGQLPNKYSHVIFHLDRGATLYYNDLRQFGWIKIVKSSKLKMQSFFKDLGPEPLDGLTLGLFQKILQDKKTKIKPLLMDQTKIGGVGNIYANDALFLAKIKPDRPANTLSKNETKKLYKSIEIVLKKGMNLGGASELNYVNALGEEGAYQKHFLVYAKEGRSCPNKCGGTIKKVKIGGRGTYFCPKCQK